MFEVIFSFEGKEKIIKCNINDKVEEITTKFLTYLENKKENKLLYIYNDSIIKSGLTFNEQASESDKKRNKMNIMIIKISE